MKIETSILILKIDPKTSKDGTDYLSISFADTNGDTFNIITKNMEYTSLQAFKQYQAILNLISTKYGLKLSLENINE